MGDIVKEKMYGGYFVLKSNYWEIFGNEYKSVVGSEQKINLGLLTDIKIVASFEFNFGPRVETSIWHNVYTLKGWKFISQEDEFKGEVNSVVASQFTVIANDKKVKALDFQAMLDQMILITQKIETVNNRITTVSTELKSSITEIKAGVTEVKQRVTVVDEVTAKLQKIQVSMNSCETQISDNILNIALNSMNLQESELTVIT